MTQCKIIFGKGKSFEVKKGPLWRKGSQGTRNYGIMNLQKQKPKGVCIMSIAENRVEFKRSE